MSYARDMVEAVRFKAVPGGYIFRMPRLWFGAAEHYLVNAAEKAELLAILAPRRAAPRVLLNLLIAALVGGAILLLVRLLGSGQADPTIGDLMIMAAAVVVAVAAVLTVDRARDRRRLVEITKRLPRANETISTCDRHHAALAVTPFWLKVTMMLASGVACAGSLMSWSYDGSAFRAATAIFFGLILIQEAVGVVQKLRRSA